MLVRSETLDRYLTRFFDLFGASPHLGAAMFELVPEWLEFLELKGLLTPELHRQTLDSMQKLKNDMMSVFKHEADEPFLISQIKYHWEK